MVTSEYAIGYIKNNLIGLVDSGRLKATYNQSSSSISFYVNDIETPKRPLLTLTLRLSDHHPDMSDYVRNHPTPPSAEDNTNISIEFYKPMYKDGKRVKNKINTSVRTNDDTIILPYNVTYFEYKPRLLENSDVQSIYKSILQWIFNNEEGGTYVDPFKGTSKEAKTATKTANIKTNFTNYAIYRDSAKYKENQENGWKNATQAEINWWKTKGMGDSKDHKGKLIEKKNTIRITESELKQIISETISRVLTIYKK